MWVKKIDAIDKLCWKFQQVQRYFSAFTRFIYHIKILLIHEYPLWYVNIYTAVFNPIQYSNIKVLQYSIGRLIHRVHKIYLYISFRRRPLLSNMWLLYKRYETIIVPQKKYNEEFNVQLWVWRRYQFNDGYLIIEYTFILW